MVAVTDSEPLRVLFLNTRGDFGADVAVHVSLARSLAGQGISVWVATTAYEAAGDASPRAEFGAIPEIEVTTEHLGRPLTGTRGVARFAAVLANGRAIVSLGSLGWACRRRRVDVVHVTDRPRDVAFGWAVARLGGASLLVHAHTSYYAHDGHRLRDALLHRSDAVVGVSRFTAASYRDTVLPAGRVYAVLNSVDGTLFDHGLTAALRPGMRARLGVPDDALLVGCVGRLMRWKCQPLLLEAFASARRSVPNARLVLAGIAHEVAPDGNGDFKDYLERRVKELGLEGAVTFAGFVSAQDMPALYAAMDVFVHPAVDEPFGLVIAEAMASGVPVVAVGAGGVCEIVQDEVSGLLVAPAAEAMADAIVRLLSDRDLAHRMANAGRARVVEAFTPARQATDMVSVYRALTSSKAVGAQPVPEPLNREMKGGQ